MQQQLQEQVNHRCIPYAAAGDARSSLTMNSKENRGTVFDCGAEANKNDTIVVSGEKEEEMMSHLQK